ncbi:hypothetical protein [Aggregatibacter kilianii]|uniref:hypothetical protein n=1 Tax=Aggregatibacter kilianii TaxID=2025884 RepID=UPI0028D3675D|nr:hypothetical protein [Aggregatibacter kilianii]
MNISASTADKNSGFNSKVGYLGGMVESSRAGFARKVEAVAVSLDGKYGGDYGSIEGGTKVFSADAEAVGKVFTGEEGKYGFEAKAAAQASAISGEVKGCLGSKDSWAVLCAKGGANAGPAGDLGAKAIWDDNRESL